MTFAAGFCSSEEIETLSAKAWRKGFSNWAHQHENPEISRNAPEVQDHTAQVQLTNYNILGLILLLFDHAIYGHFVSN